MEDVDAAGESIGSATVSHDASGVPVIKLSGEIDMSNVDALRGTIDPVVEHGPERVDFDLSALEFMDSSGIALLLRVRPRHNRCTCSNRRRSCVAWSRPPVSPTSCRSSRE
jgi:anti-anti-sigma factor